ncbi:hypothetical protein B4113_1457 [Geobacillus sp. B4113_201601]|nr:hypothetical protein B4113_1457 [Geobacillus sp. B4113_201601]
MTHRNEQNRSCFILGFRLMKRSGFRLNMAIFFPSRPNDALLTSLAHAETHK